jgi:hypothetical protein
MKMQSSENKANFFIKYSGTIVNDLNILAPLYHTGFGGVEFDPESQNLDITEAYELVLPIISFASQKLKHFPEIIITKDAENDADTFFDLNVFHGDPKDLEKCQFFIENLTPHLLELAQKPLLYDKIVIMYKNDTWYKKPEEWYNKPEGSGWWKYSSYKNTLLPSLKSRQWIVVDDPFVKVTIYANLKKGPIIIDDVLFATKALAKDDTITIDHGYNFIKFAIEDELSILYIEPVMDNSSA